MKSKNYCVTARLNKEDFTEVIERFPDLYGKLKNHSRRYQDNLKKQLKEAITRTSYIEKLSEDIIEEMVYTLKQEQFENGNVIFREGEQCKGIIFVMEGNIELSHSESGQSIVLDNLLAGSYLFAYTCLTEEKTSITGIARGKTTILVLPYQTLEATRRVSEEFNEALEAIEDYITYNGVPRCDYTRYRATESTAKQRMRAAVHRLISILKHENAKKMQFTDWINVLQATEKNSGLGF